MSAPNDGGPAFPLPSEIGKSHFDDPGAYPGMTLRDYFAAHERLTDWDSENATMHPGCASALAGEPSPEKEKYQNEKEYAVAFFRWEAKWRAAFKYIRADAMLAARKAKT